MSTFQLELEKYTKSSQKVWQQQLPNCDLQYQDNNKLLVGVSLAAYYRMLVYTIRKLFPFSFVHNKVLAIQMAEVSLSTE